MAKRALLVGCNYPGTKAELHGCVNDVTRMYKCLVDRFGFAEEDITVMVDTDKRSVQPTGANIKSVLGKLISQSQDGDILFFHYSGHGTQVPAESGDDEDDGLDEAIVPTDLNLMTDDDFRLLFKNIKDGVAFTFVSDSCHSGGLIDHEKEQIGDGVEIKSFESPVPAQSRGYGSRSYEQESRDYDFRGERNSHHSHHEYGHRHARGEQEEDERVPFRNKSLSIETLAEMLSQQSGHEVKPGNIRTSLFDLFGKDASPTVKVFVNLIASKLGGQSDDAQGGSSGGGGIWGAIGGLAVDFLKTKLNSNSSATEVVSNAVSHSGHAGAKPAKEERVPEETGVLVSGCQSNETSADANPTGNPAQAYGALSNGIQTILAETKGPISNGQLVTKVRALLKKQGFSQHPCLYSSDRNVNAPFIWLHVTPLTPVDDQPLIPSSDHPPNPPAEGQSPVPSSDLPPKPPSNDTVPCCRIL